MFPDEVALEDEVILESEKKHWFITKPLLKKEITKEERIEMVTKSMTKVLEDLGIDFTDDNFTKTPYRWAKKVVNETMRGLFDKIEDLNLTTFDNKKWYKGIVLVGPIQVKSQCAHHLENVIGEAYIGYIPKDRLLGLSKFSRIVDHFSRKPSTQELLIEEISQFLQKTLDTNDIAVVIKAEHHCMKVRGVEEPCANTATASMNGLFMHSDSTREEFYELLKLERN